MSLGPWRVYWPDKPSRSAQSLADAQQIAQRNLNYRRCVEIAELATGRHLMWFEDRWTETRPAGSPIRFWKARRDTEEGAAA